MTRRTLCTLAASAALTVLTIPSTSFAGDDYIGPPIPDRILRMTKPTDSHAGHDHAAGSHSLAATRARTATSRLPAAQPAKVAQASNSFAPVLPPADYQPPELVLSEDTFDFGRRFKGDEVTHEFEFVNKGGSNLVINKIKPGCGCTYVKHDKNIAPGAKGKITLKINTARLSAGKQSKWADIHSNDPKNLKKRVFMKGEVATPFNQVPKAARLQLVRGENASLEVTLHKAVDMPLKITDVKALNSRVLHELTETEPGKTYSLKVTPNYEGNDKLRHFSDRLSVEVEGPDGNKMSQDVPVTITLKDRISAKPSRTVYFRRPEVQQLRAGGDGVTKEVVVKSEVADGTHKFTITKVELSESRFKARVEPVQDGREYKVIVEIDQLPDDPTLKSLKSDLTIHTDDAAQPLISMRVLAFI